MKKMSNKTRLKQNSLSIKKVDESINLFGVSINSTQKSQLLKKIFVQRKNLLHVATVNPEYVMEARGNSRFREILAQTEIKVADGWGVVWAARILYDKYIERVTGVELVKLLLERANSRGEKVFLLGSRPGVAEKAAEEMKKKYRDLKIAWYEGARTVKLEKSEEASMTIAKINAYEPDYLLVAYGSPWQDIWIEDNRPYLRARVAMGVGGTLDEWAGEVKQTPEWMDKVGLKWLHRLVTQPWRWKRIGRVLYFGILVMWKSIKDIK